MLGQAAEIVKRYEVTPEIKILESWGDKIASVLWDDAKNWQADLVVMGTHGWSGLMHILMGSVAEGLLKLVEVPILLIRNNEKS